MVFKPRLVAVLAALVCSPSVQASAGQTINEAGVITCVTDKWDEQEPEKGHKLVDFAGRCVEVPDDRASDAFTEDCSGKYEYLPNGSWSASGTCTRKLKDGETITDRWEEGSHLKEYTFTVVEGTGRYKGAKGGGTYTMQNLTDTLGAGRISGTLVLP